MNRFVAIACLGSGSPPARSLSHLMTSSTADAGPRP